MTRKIQKGILIIANGNGGGKMNQKLLIGTVKNENQLQINLEKCFYHIPKTVVPEKEMPVDYVALYLPQHIHESEEKGCIPYYGEVSSIELVPRAEIPVLPFQNPEMLYYKISVKEWKPVPEKIVRGCGSIYTKVFTDLQKLLEAKELSDIVDVSYFEEKKIRSCGFSDEELQRIEISDDPIGIKLLTQKINQAAGREKLLPVQISKYLLEQGYLEMEFDEQTGKSNRVASEKGRELGIECFWELNKYYREYCKNYYGPRAQKFIIDHLNDIIFIDREEAYSNEI